MVYKLNEDMLDPLVDLQQTFQKIKFHNFDLDFSKVIPLKKL